VGWVSRFRQRRSERASYEAFLRWHEGAEPRDEAEAQQFEELDYQYSWEESPEEEPGPPPWEPVEWSEPESAASARVVRAMDRRRDLRETIQAAADAHGSAPDGQAWSEARVDLLDATNAQFCADGELGEATSAFDQVREAAQAERAAQWARDHEQAGGPQMKSADGTAGADPGADKEAGS
jgi:hypothetical protein